MVMPSMMLSILAGKNLPIFPIFEVRAENPKIFCNIGVQINKLDTLCTFRANVAVRRELHTPASDRSCTHLEFDIAGSGLM